MINETCKVKVKKKKKIDAKQLLVYSICSYTLLQHYILLILLLSFSLVT